MGHETLNPLTRKGSIRYSSFVLSVVCIAVFNLIVSGLVHAQLLTQKLRLDTWSLALTYAIWFVVSLLGFTMMSNTFLKRWKTVWGGSDCPTWLRYLVRLSLLSPIGSWFALALGLLTTSKIPIFNGEADEPRRNIAVGWAVSILLALLIGYFSLGRAFGLIEPRFKDSMEFAGPNGVRTSLPMPNDFLYRGFYGVLTPSLRYGVWVLADWYRARTLDQAVNNGSEVLLRSLCFEKLGMAGIPVHDCYFRLLRKSSQVTPYAVPFFALMYETKYRKAVRLALDQKPMGLEYEFANALVAISNSIEILETDGLTLDRRVLTEPNWLSKVFGSPDLVLVEAGNDLSRLGVNLKLVSAIEVELNTIENEFYLSRRNLGDKEIDISSKLRSLRSRLNELKRRPLLL